jgi:hypothetical protein
MPIDLVSQLVSVSIRASGLGLIALAGLWLFRIRSSAAQHATWTVVLAGMLLQIPLGVVAPTVQVKALPARIVRPIQRSIQPRSIELERISEPVNQTRKERKSGWAPSSMPLPWWKSPKRPRLVAAFWIGE